MEFVIYTWKEYFRNHLKGVDWNQLKTFVNALRGFSKNLLANDIIEEDLPRINDEKFSPGGWVGVYDLGKDTIKVVPDPGKLSESEFHEIMRELVGWLEAIGPAARELFGRYMNTLILERKLYTLFSRHLVEYTEIVLSHFIPRKVSVKNYIGKELRGKPVWNKIIPLRAKGLQLLASKRMSFDLRSLPNLLLTRFHAELLAKINALFGALNIKETPKFLEELRKYQRYHERFISESVFAELLEEALSIDFGNPEILDNVRRSAKGVLLEVLDLWEAYIGRKAFLTDFGRVFNTALKPLSKIYELWCYKKLCDILKISENHVRRCLNKVPFRLCGKAAILHYNPPGGLGKYSKIMKELGVQPGRPDFMVESNGKITCVMDAKCKIKLSTDDIQRLLSYLLDYVYPVQEKLVALIFYLSREPRIKSVRIKNCEIYLVSLMPKTYTSVKEKVKSIIESTLIN